MHVSLLPGGPIQASRFLPLSQTPPIATVCVCVQTAWLLHKVSLPRSQTGVLKKIPGAPAN